MPRIKSRRKKLHNKKAKKFDFMLLEAIDEALSALGESVKKSVYFHLEISYNIQRNEIPNKIAEFSDSLDKMFGLGARYLEILIIKKFYPKIQVTFNWPGPEFIIPDLAFKECIELMEKQFRKQAEKAKIEFFIDDCRNKECVAELKNSASI
jgi:hypothetical protein